MKTTGISIKSLIASSCLTRSGSNPKRMVWGLMFLREGCPPMADSRSRSTRPAAQKGQRDVPFMRSAGLARGKLLHRRIQVERPRAKTERVRRRRTSRSLSREACCTKERTCLHGSIFFAASSYESNPSTLPLRCRSIAQDSTLSSSKGRRIPSEARRAESRGESRGPLCKGCNCLPRSISTA